MAAASSCAFRERSMPLVGDSSFVGSGKPHSTTKPAMRLPSSWLTSLMSEAPVITFIFCLIVCSCSSVSFATERTTTGSMDWVSYMEVVNSLQMGIRDINRFFFARKIMNFSMTVDSRGCSSFTIRFAVSSSLWRGSLTTSLSSSQNSSSRNLSLILMTSFVTVTDSFAFSAPSIKALTYAMIGPLFSTSMASARTCTRARALRADAARPATPRAAAAAAAPKPVVAPCSCLAL
mmetsp:Transcript_100156/g.292096  ORF Transcript_100156/g.292096 Transcript_100156/m.292096 type:complete len:234 (+) Transcript_100156:128-829(+)